jgi:Uma2 family endonuclease
MGASTTLLTFEEFEQLPDTPGKRELLKGELIELPPAKQEHNEISELIFIALREFVHRLRLERPDLPLGKTRIETGYQISHSTWLQPDVSLTHPEQPIQGYYQGAPLLAAEVVSESNTAPSIEKKINEYLTHGGRDVSVVYPETRTVWVYREGGATRYETVLNTDSSPDSPSISNPCSSPHE